jgi:NAD(P)-dependent dehydrogenase (short-subunit alcohol dehydrogenase family)
MNDKFISINQLKSSKKNKFKKIYCLITGGAGRIGSIYTSLLLKKGYNVIVASRKNISFKKYKSSLDKKFQKKIQWLKLDLSNLNTVDILLKKISNKSLLYLINNASFSFRGNFYNYNKKNIVKEATGISLGSIYLTEKILPSMRKNNNGKIIFTGSLWGNMIPKFDTYLDMDIGPTAMIASSKASIQQYSKYIAVREAVYNITVNSLIPGWFPRKGPIERIDYINKITSNIPMSRIGNLSDLIKPIEFLLSENNNYMTGQEIIVDGGYSLY